MDIIEPKKPVSCHGVLDGYLLSSCGICIEQNSYTDWVYKEAQTIKFSKGQILPIKEKIITDKYYYFYLNADGILNEEQAGKINKVRFLRADGSYLPEGLIIPYGSQYGLQGKVFLAMSHIIPDSVYNLKNYIDVMKTLCGMMSFCVFIAIGYYVGVKYDNWLLATAFWLTFMTSQWVINFAFNLYWVEFTWFIPMLIGLYCSIHGNSWRTRWLCYVLAFLSILIKSLCGYEYLSTIMIALVMFPLADAVKEWRRKNYRLLKKALCMVVCLGIAGLLGFGVALSKHAYKRGYGNISLGIEQIYYGDVLRRTWATNSAKQYFPKVYRDSLDAGISDMFKLYCLRWKSNILMGIPGKLFPMFALVPFGFYMYHQRRRKQPFNKDIITLYALSFIATFSWYALAKSHSYIHLHMNYVLWYFGFVQICLYTLLDCIKNFWCFLTIQRKESKLKNKEICL